MVVDTLLTVPTLRVYANANVGGLHVGRWADVDAGDQRLAGWMQAGLISRTGPQGAPPPLVLPAPLCCGRNR